MRKKSTGKGEPDNRDAPEASPHVRAELGDALATLAGCADDLAQRTRDPLAIMVANIATALCASVRFAPGHLVDKSGPHAWALRALGPAAPYAQQRTGDRSVAARRFLVWIARHVRLLEADAPRTVSPAARQRLQALQSKRRTPITTPAAARAAISGMESILAQPAAWAPQDAAASLAAAIAMGLHTHWGALLCERLPVDPVPSITRAVNKVLQNVPLSDPEASERIAVAALRAVGAANAGDLFKFRDRQVKRGRKRAAAR